MIWLLPILLALIIGCLFFSSDENLSENTRIDRIIVFKSQRRMQVYDGTHLLKTYRISLGKNPVGRKQFEGDNRTPEGSYRVDSRNANSKFHKNLGISYPNKTDLDYAQSIGKPAGGDIKIHGLRNGRGWRRKLHLYKDWTAGCIAVTNREMDELFAFVVDDASIEIRA